MHLIKQKKIKKMYSKPYTQFGMTGKVTTIKLKNGEKTYKKQGLSNKGIQNYVKAAKQKFGIPLSHIDQQKGEVTMTGGTILKKLQAMSDLKTAIQFKTLGFSQEEKMNIFIQIAKIQLNLQIKKISHCDVKPQNIVYLNKKVYLIDNENISNFGQIRKVGTPNVNCNYYNIQNGQIVDQKTDKEGFKNLVNFIGNHLFGQKFQAQIYNYCLYKLQDKYLQAKRTNSLIEIQSNFNLNCQKSMDFIYFKLEIEKTNGKNLAVSKFFI